jgi:WD40 repeat protein
MILFLINISIFAQDSPPPPPISAENFRGLKSVARINFEDMAAEFNAGWFALNDAGNLYALVDVTGRVFTLREDNNIEYSFTVLEDGNAYPGSLVDATIDKTQLYTVHIIDGQTYVGQNLIKLSGFPQSLWVHDERLYIEALPTGMDSTTQINIFDSNTLNLVDTIPYAPAQDTETIVRIGRIPPPYVVTSSIDGIVKLWNLETGETVYEVDNGTGEASVFGNINADATHLVWRDRGSNSLYLLNFETGENRFIDELEGGYVQWFFLINDASVIIAVNTDFEPNIIVWAVETGERIILGEYRQCNRPQPDMARLSADGTTLVIGCDTGLDIWRILED